MLIDNLRYSLADTHTHTLQCSSTCYHFQTS